MCFPIFRGLSHWQRMGVARFVEANNMNNHRLSLLLPVLLVACATDLEPQHNTMQDYEEVDTTTVLDAPSPNPGSFAPEHRFQVARGKYLVELLGCGACHTDGSLEGIPNTDLALAGSDIGIAFANPLGNENPGIVFPPNITPDKDTGIGLWSDKQIARAIRVGIGRHARRRIAVMPWKGYTKMTEEDLTAIVGYLRSISPIHHQVPNEIEPGQKTNESFVYFGVYRSR